MRTRTSTSFDWQFLAKILRNFITSRLILLYVSIIGCSVILFDDLKMPNCYRAVDLF